MEDLLWELFKKTGSIRYYLLIKELGSVSSEVIEDKWNSSRGTELQ